MKTIGWGLVLLLGGCAHVQPRLTRAEKRALKAQGVAAYRAKDWARCIELLEKAGDAYDAACCRAQAGDVDGAFTQLFLAVKQHGPTPAHVRADADLAPLHGDPRWPMVLSSFEARASRQHQELRALFEEDQADRQTKEIDWSLVSRRDAERQQRVLELLDAGAAKVSEDYFHAAMVFQHGDTIAHITRAHDLALKAVALDPEHLLARWLVAATEDRGLMYLKKPQKYGTQYQGPAPWVLYEVDPSTTDAEREEWNVPSLEEARSLLLRMNANGLPTPAK